MIAIQMISPDKNPADFPGLRSVAADTQLTDVLPMLLDAPARMLAVGPEGHACGVIDESSLLDALGRLIAPRYDSSTIVVECLPEQYAASRIAHAVEDADAHLVDLWTAPASDGHMRATVRVRHSDPSAAAHSLERYGYRVVETSGAMNSDAIVASERLLALQSILSI